MKKLVNVKLLNVKGQPHLLRYYLHEKGRSWGLSIVRQHESACKEAYTSLIFAKKETAIAKLNLLIENSVTPEQLPDILQDWAFPWIIPCYVSVTQIETREAIS